MYDYTRLQTALQDDLKTEEVMLTSDMSLPDASKLWLELSIFKKFEGKKKLDADAKCLALFKESNERCRQFRFSNQGPYDGYVVEEVKNLLEDMLFSGPDRVFNLSRCFEGFDTGPGASLASKSFNFYTKLFDSELSSTSESLYALYGHAIRNHPVWLDAEHMRRQIHGNRVVVGNRLSFVPKTSDISRSICTEPTLNMLFQKGIGSFLESLLIERLGINLSTQPLINRRMAKMGSIDGSFGTIDLSSASDSISLHLLKEILPKYFLHWLEIARSPSVVYPDGETSELYMVSSMGNGFTFPLETLLFATIVVACYRVKGIKPLRSAKNLGNMAVFGDDIIVRKDCYEFVTDSLKNFGFLVNDSKSFNTGDFRESCGEDYFRGHDIRGVYCKSLSNKADVYSLTNRLVRWTAKSGVFLPKTLSILLEYLGDKILFIPPEDGDAEGLKVPFPPSDYLKRLDKDTGAIVYRALVSKATQFKVPEASETKILNQRGYTFKYNPSGLYLALLRGSVRNGRIQVRSNLERFKVRRRITSSWGGSSAARFVSGADPWVWACAHYFNEIMERR